MIENPFPLLLGGIVSLLILYFIIMLAVRSGNEVSKRNKQIAIQNHLLVIVARKLGCSEEDLDEAYKENS